jgi:hypothetical protein
MGPISSIEDFNDLVVRFTNKRINQTVACTQTRSKSSRTLGRLSVTTMPSEMSTNRNEAILRVQYRISNNRLIAEKIHMNRSAETLRASYEGESAEVMLIAAGNHLIATSITLSQQNQTNEMTSYDHRDDRQDHEGTSISTRSNTNFKYAFPSVLADERDKLIFEQTVCCICHEDYSSDIRISRLPCGHLYHHLCLEEWLEIRRSCPSCRLSLIDICIVPG